MDITYIKKFLPFRKQLYKLKKSYLGKENLVIFKDEPSNQPPIIVGDNSRLINEVKYNCKYNIKNLLLDIKE